jgi:hypothetical protein
MAISRGTSRSPNYPAISLPEALDLVAKVYQREKRSPADPERIALALGYRSMSGPARTKLSGLRKFGLVEETGNGVRLSDLAMTILYPRTPDEKRDALRTAATTPGLFRELAEYPGASDDNLVSRLVRTGFTEAGARSAVASFRKTMSLAPEEATGYDGPDEEADEVLAAAPAALGTERQRPGGQLPAGARTLSIPLPDGVMAELRWAGGPLTKRALGLLRKYLDLYEETISEPEATEAAPPSLEPYRPSSELERPS